MSGGTSPRERLAEMRGEVSSGGERILFNEQILMSCEFYFDWHDNQSAKQVRSTEKRNKVEGCKKERQPLSTEGNGL